MPKDTKALAVIALIQLAAIILLYNKMAAVENGVAAAISTKQIELQQEYPSQTEASINPDHANVLPVEERLRQIIREELSMQLADLPRRDQPRDAAVAINSTSEAEMESQRELISQQLEYYSSVGSISDLEMQLLQTEIAKLDAASRKEMFSQLTRALNSGRLDGRL
jgi:uncharacterized small protein (DUF1192 family)